MPMVRILVALLTVLPALSHADAKIPDTPAGHALSAWLDAINSADRPRQEAFLKDYPSWMSVEGLANWSAGTGGYQLLAVYSSDPANVFFHVKQNRWAVEELGRLQVRAAKPFALEALEVWRMPVGSKFEPVTLDDAARARVVARIAEDFDTAYVDPQLGKRMAAALRSHAARGAYRAMPYGEVFARELTKELQEISQDKHVEVKFSYFVRPEESSAMLFEEESRRMAAINCGFDQAKHLPPNIGYLKFDMFADPAICATTASAAFTFLADSDALIIDLRDNHGGRSGMVEYIASYLFAERTHLDDIFNRIENSTHEEWTLPYVPGRKFVGKPVFVLTSKGTFSAAEALSYWLKNLKRATLIGETTMGGAHPTQTRPIDDRFSVRMPYARSINPITGTNWEGTGVEPDVKVVAEQALDVALKLAAEQIGRNRSTAAQVR